MQPTTLLLAALALAGAAQANLKDFKGWGFKGAGDKGMPMKPPEPTFTADELPECYKKCAKRDFAINDDGSWDRLKLCAWEGFGQPLNPAVASKRPLPCIVLNCPPGEIPKNRAVYRKKLCGNDDWW